MVANPPRSQTKEGPDGAKYDWLTSMRLPDSTTRLTIACWSAMRACLDGGGVTMDVPVIAMILPGMSD
jgi:hypothetical protein